MGANTSMLIGASGDARTALGTKPALNREGTIELARRLFPDQKLEAVGDGDLSYTSPPHDEVHAGVFPGVSIVAANDFAIDYPSRLERRFLHEIGTTIVYLHAMHSVVDWFAFAVWKDGQLQRSLSLSPESGILEDIGPRWPFEMPYWSGNHPVTDPEDEEDGEPSYPFPFHPLDLGEAAMKEFFGYQLEGLMDDTLLEPESITLVRFSRKKPWFKGHVR